MDKELTIKVTDKVDIFKVYLAAINWTLGANSLTESEIEIFSILLYYNDIYKEIKKNKRNMNIILDKFPMFYSTPKVREYIMFEDNSEIKIKTKMSKSIFDRVSYILENERDLFYLGNSESLVSVYLKLI